MKGVSSNIHSDPLLGAVLKQLDIAVFMWQENGFFQPLCSLPSWFNQLYFTKSLNRANDDLEYYLGTHFPFIENFLYDAEQVWSERQNSSLRSGLWTEDVSEYQELYLEAVALNIDSQPVLLIVNETSNFDLRHKVFQNARNLALKNEKLESSVQDHQRQLQKQLEKLYKKDRLKQQLPDEIEQESSAVLICKQDGGVEVYNKALIDIYSLNNDDELQRHSLLQKWIKEAEKQYPEIHRVLKSGKHWEGEFETHDAKHAKKWVRLTIAPSTNESGEVQHFICIANDISHIRLSISEIERLTQIDTTTQLPNRRSFWQYLSTEINKQQATPTGLALLYLDLDNFRRVNDDLGPKQADFLLNTVATRLKRCLKKNDYVAHLGGDEFAVVIVGFTDQHSLATIAQRIKENIYRDVSFSDFTLNVGTSIGIAVYPQHGVKARQLVKSADYAMYHAKEMGRNQFQFSSPYSRRRIKQKLHIEQGLKEALRNSEFELLFQPQIAIGSTTEHRLEALIGWQHPLKGRI
ncbi:MAG: diguanylate cyclase, partial [Kangiellaceae bacterium]|nr:diguanylate cyclase [Kangiellaceae bacterium]